MRNTKETIEIPRLGAHVEIEKEECAELIDDLYTLAGLWEQVRSFYRTTVIPESLRKDFSRLEDIQAQIQDHITHKILLSADRAYKNRELNSTVITCHPLEKQE
jgi:hypothetical protein